MDSNKRQGVIYKALSGFYYIRTDDGEIQCTARGKFRKDGIVPLVGDKVIYSLTGGSAGVLEEILPRKTAFVRPPVANLETMIIVASEVNPVSDPFLIDRITVVAEHSSCDCIICINKADVQKSDRLYNIYSLTGYKTIYTSAFTGEGIEELRESIKGKMCSFVGNSGAGKSSLLNALDDSLSIQTAEVSKKLGRGRHTTRHVELYSLSNGAVIADTPGFSSFDTQRVTAIRPRELQYLFREFTDYIGTCKFDDCAHITEESCAIAEAVRENLISPVRLESYRRMYGEAKQLNEWEIDKRQ